MAEAAEHLCQMTIGPNAAPVIGGDRALVSAVTWADDGGFSLSLQCIGLRTDRVRWDDMPVFVCRKDDPGKVVAVQPIDALGRVTFANLAMGDYVLRASTAWARGEVPAAEDAETYRAVRGNVRFTVARSNADEYNIDAESDDPSEQGSDVLAAILPAEPSRPIISRRVQVHPHGMLSAAPVESRPALAAAAGDRVVVFCVLPKASR
jgi:hypothetical protein